MANHEPYTNVTETSFYKDNCFSNTRTALEKDHKTD